MASEQAFRWIGLVGEHPGLGLITRRSRVQIPPPLLKAPVSDVLTGASTVLCRFFYRVFFPGRCSVISFSKTRAVGHWEYPAVDSIRFL